MLRIHTLISSSLLSVSIAVAAFAQDTVSQNTAPQTKLTVAEISTAITADIEDAERMSGSTVSVDVQSGIAVLSGTANSLLDKRLASQVARRTRGIVAVQNQVVVPASNRSDDEIREDVFKVLAINDSVTGPRITADVTHGEVDTWRQLQVAMDLAIEAGSGQRAGSSHCIENQTLITAMFREGGCE